MPVLGRRRYKERLDCWHIYFGDVHVGTIARRAGIPHDKDPWGWTCGFYPGSNPDDQQHGNDGAPADAVHSNYRVRI